MKRWPAGAAIILAIAIAGCRVRGGAPEGDESAAPPASAVTMAVSAARVAVAPMRRELRLLGTTVATRRLQLRSPSAGRVIGFNLQIGDRVQRGEVVAQVLNREIEAAINGLAIAQRLEPDEAPALAQSVRRYSHDGGVAVVAPEDGIVAQRLVTSGQMVGVLDPLAELIDPRSVNVEAAVPIGDLELIRPGMDATITSPMMPGAAMPGRVAALSPSLNPGGATSPVRVEFTTSQRVSEAGAPVEVSITAASEPDAVVIPVVALYQDAGIGGYHVFLAGADGHAHRTPVTIGIRSGNRVQVTSGVRPGDLVITSGGYALADGLKVKVTVTPQ